MQIWVDADACPKAIKDIIFRAAIRTETVVMLVANQPLHVPVSAYIKRTLVTAGFDVADSHIVANMQPGDLVITADIPLADAVITKGGSALNPRGEFYTTSNIKQKLSLRNFHAELRSSGMMTGGPPTLSKKEIQFFANCLDQFLSSH